MAEGDLFAEIWSRPGSNPFERKEINIPGPVSGTKRMAAGIGQGTIQVPVTWDRLPDVIHRVPGDPSLDVRRLVRVFSERDSGVAKVVDEFFLDNTDDESGEGDVKIVGAGIASLVADGITYPWDWDGEDESKSTFPDWIWGGKDVVGPVLTTYQAHISSVAVIGTGGAISGNVDIDITGTTGGTQTATVAWNATAGTVQAAIIALSNVTAATVTGAGTEQNPWEIEIEAPADTWTVSVDGSGLTNAVARISLIQFGKLLPIGWTESRVGNTTVPHGILTDFRASDGSGSDPDLPADCSAWVVFLGQEWYYPGVQKVVNVTPGGIYQVPPLYLYASGASVLLRIVIRDLYENLLAFEEITVPSNTVTQSVGIQNVIIPEGITQVVFRIGHIGPGDPPRVFIACPEMREGFAPDSAGGIVDVLFDDMTVNHVADGRVVWENLASPGTSYLDFTATAAVDSDGVGWDNTELTFTAQRGKTFLQVLTDLNHLGYIWSVTPNPSISGRWNLNLYNPDWVDVNATSLPSPAINLGSGVTGGPIFRSHMGGNAVTVEGKELNFGRAESPSSITSIGRREVYQPDRALPTKEMATTRALEEVAKRLLSGLSVAVQVDPVVGPVPFLDYDVDWVLNVQVPPVLPKSAHRLAAVSYTITDQATTYQLSFSSEAFAGTAGTLEAVRRLLLKFEGLDREPPENVFQAEGGCCPSCPAIAEGSLSPMTLDGQVNWTVTDDPDDLLFEMPSGDLQFRQPGLYTIHFAWDMTWTTSTTGWAVWEFLSAVTNNCAANGMATVVTAARTTASATMRVKASISHFVHVIEAGETYSAAWDMVVEQTAGMLSAGALGDSARRRVTIIRIADACEIDCAGCA